MRSNFTINRFILKCNLGQIWAKVFVVQEIFLWAICRFQTVAIKVSADK